MSVSHPWSVRAGLSLDLGSSPYAPADGYFIPASSPRASTLASAAEDCGYGSQRTLVSSAAATWGSPGDAPHAAIEVNLLYNSFGDQGVLPRLHLTCRSTG